MQRLIHLIKITGKALITNMNFENNIYHLIFSIGIYIKSNL